MFESQPGVADTSSSFAEDANCRTRPEPHILGTYGPVVLTMVLANLWTWVFRHSAG